MKFSVITVVYNGVKTIEDTIISVFGQKDADFEYIVIDGDSSDGSKDIISRYLDRIDYYISEPDYGIYNAMNKGLRHASGDYVIFMNADDRFASNDVLSRVADYIGDDEEILIGREYIGDKLSDLPDMDDAVSPYYGIFYPHQSTFSPLITYKKIGFFDESLSISADYEWLYRAMLNGSKVRWIDEVITVFGTGGRSMMMQSVIDEYNVSLKYLRLAGQENLIPDMTKKSIAKAADFIVRSVLDNDKYDYVLNTLIDKYFDRSGAVRIWGAGFVAEGYIRAIKRCGLRIDLIIDSNKAGDRLHGIEIAGYAPNLVRRVFITTELYDDEISSLLIRDGFRDGVDFISHRLFVEEVISLFDEGDELLEIYREGTGIDLKTQYNTLREEN